MSFHLALGIAQISRATLATLPIQPRFSDCANWPRFQPQRGTLLLTWKRDVRGFIDLVSLRGSRKVAEVNAIAEKTTTRLASFLKSRSPETPAKRRPRTGRPNLALEITQTDQRLPT
ncbi:hypothetical protein KM043_008465 [Ampulex compressa]|nr:hypothetical protein KM043_008465 [Ampulex compressa]